MPITRKSLADTIDAFDDEIATLQDSKRETFTSYREQLAGEGKDKDEVKAEIEATKVAIRRRQTIAKKGAETVEEKDALVDEIFSEITAARAPRATRVEIIEKFPPHDAETGEIIEHESTAVDLDGEGGRDAPALPVDTNEPEGPADDLTGGENANSAGNAGTSHASPDAAVEKEPSRQSHKLEIAGARGGESAASNSNVTPFTPKRQWQGPVSSTGLSRPIGCQHVDECPKTWRAAEEGVPACHRCRVGIAVVAGGDEIEHQGSVS